MGDEVLSEVTLARRFRDVESDKRRAVARLKRLAPAGAEPTAEEIAAAEAQVPTDQTFFLIKRPRIAQPRRAVLDLLNRVRPTGLHFVQLSPEFTSADSDLQQEALEVFANENRSADGPGLRSGMVRSTADLVRLVKDEAAGTEFFTSVKNAAVFGIYTKIPLLLEKLGIRTSIVDDAHRVTRLAVYLKRTGRVEIDLTAPEEVQPQDGRHEGGVLLVDGMRTALQGTFVWFAKEIVLMKGVMRGTLAHYRTPKERKEEAPIRVEAAGLAQDGEFEFQVPPGTRGKFSIIAQVQRFSASLNLQLVVFSFRHPEVIIQEILDVIKTDPIDAVLTPRQRTMRMIGFPITLFKVFRAVYKLITKWPVAGARTMVMAMVADVDGNEGMPRDGVLFGHRQLAALRAAAEEQDEELKEGETFLPAGRDPGRPLGGSVQGYRFLGQARWSDGMPVEDGIVISAYRAEYKEHQDGDVDGDALVVWFMRRFVRASLRMEPTTVDREDLVSKDKIQLVGSSRGVSWTGTRRAVTNRLSDAIGSSVNAALRLALEGLLDAEAAAASDTRVLICIRALKKVVNSFLARSANELLRKRAEQLDPSYDLIGAVGAIKNAKGDEAKAKAFDEAAVTAEKVLARDNPPKLLSLIAEFITVLRDLDRKLAFIKTQKVEFPQSMRDVAREKMKELEAGGNPVIANQLVAQAQGVTKLWNELSADFAELLKREAELGKETFQMLSQQLNDQYKLVGKWAEQLLREGVVGPYTAIHVWPARVIYNLVDPRDVLEVAVSRKDTAIALLPGAEFEKNKTYTSSAVLGEVVEADRLELLSYPTFVVTDVAEDGSFMHITYEDASIFRKAMLDALALPKEEEDPGEDLGELFRPEDTVEFDDWDFRS